MSALWHHVVEGKKGGVNPDVSGSSGGVISVREKLSLALTLGSDTLQTFYMHKIIYNTIWDRENPKKHNKSSLIGVAAFKTLTNSVKTNEELTKLQDVSSRDIPISKGVCPQQAVRASL